MAWVLHPYLNIDVRFIIDTFIAQSEIYECLCDTIEKVENIVKNSIIEELTDTLKNNYCLYDVYKSILLARDHNVLTTDVRQMIHLWREEEEYMNEYDDGPYCIYIESLRTHIDLICEYTSDYN